jgi:tight adherence protein B
LSVFGVPRWLPEFSDEGAAEKVPERIRKLHDIIVRGVKSGLPLNECLGIIARESPEPIAANSRKWSSSSASVFRWRMLRALWRAHAAARSPKFLTIVIGIQQKLAVTSPRRLATFRKFCARGIRMAMKVKALSAEANGFCAVLGMLPFIVAGMVYMSSTPDYIMPLFTTKIGQFMIAGGLFWMGHAA